MSEENKMMASFRVDREDWGKFGALAKGERLTVTQLLTDYIDWCLVAGKSMYGVRMVPDGNTYQVSTAPTPDGIQAAIDEAIERAIAPIQLDLAELLGQVDKLRVSIDGRPQASKPQASEKPKLAITKPAGEVGKVVDRLLKDADLLKAVRAEIAIGGTSSEIAERLLASGHGTSNSGPHSPAAISRFRAALAYLDNPETAAQADS